jgi:GR25 family glycosyltransferase involved in LPS biosynthesis
MRISSYIFLFLSFTQLFSGHVKSDPTPTLKYLRHFDNSYQPTGLDPIDAIYVINLDERPEKWKRMNGIADKEGLHFTRVPGINGWKFTKTSLKEMTGPYPIRLTPGGFGCLLSHVSILKEAFEQGYNLIWVMEDDIIVLDDIKLIPQLLAQLDQIDPDWDVFYTDTDSVNVNGERLLSLAYSFRPDQEHLPPQDYLTRKYLTDDIMRLGQRYGNYSYIISKKGIKKILYYFTHVYIWSPFDVDIHYIPDIREYSVTKDIVSVIWDGPSNTMKPIESPSR